MFALNDDDFAKRNANMPLAKQVKLTSICFCNDERSLHKIQKVTEISKPITAKLYNKDKSYTKQNYFKYSVVFCLICLLAVDKLQYKCP